MATFWINLKEWVDENTYDEFNKEMMDDTAGYLREYFNKACAGHDEFTESDTRWKPKKKDIGPKDVLCYILNDQLASLVRQYAPDQVPEAGGLTYFANISDDPDNEVRRMISEAYMEKVVGDGNHARLLANLIFHELMHNKCDANPDKSVTTDYHKLNKGLAKFPITPESRPVQEEYDLLRKALSIENPQYTGYL